MLATDGVPFIEQIIFTRSAMQLVSHLRNDSNSIARQKCGTCVVFYKQAIPELRLSASRAGVVRASAGLDALVSASADNYRDGHFCPAKGVIFHRPIPTLAVRTPKAAALLYLPGRHPSCEMSFSLNPNALPQRRCGKCVIAVDTTSVSLQRREEKQNANRIRAGTDRKICSMYRQFKKGPLGYRERRYPRTLVRYCSQVSP